MSRSKRQSLPGRPRPAGRDSPALRRQPARRSMSRPGLQSPPTTRPAGRQDPPEHHSGRWSTRRTAQRPKRRRRGPSRRPETLHPVKHPVVQRRHRHESSRPSLRPRPRTRSTDLWPCCWETPTPHSAGGSRAQRPRRARRRPRPIPRRHPLGSSVGACSCRTRCRPAAASPEAPSGGPGPVCRPLRAHRFGAALLSRPTPTRPSQRRPHLSRPPRCRPSLQHHLPSRCRPSPKPPGRPGRGGPRTPCPGQDPLPVRFQTGPATLAGPVPRSPGRRP